MMNSFRMRWLLVGALVLTGIVFVLICMLSFSKLDAKSHKLVALRLQNHTAETQLTNLPEIKRQVEKYGYFNDVAKSVLPSDKDQAQAVLDIYQMANESSIAIQDLTFPASNLGASSGTNDSKTKTKSNISQAVPVTEISGLYSIPLTITPQNAVNLPPDKKVTYEKFLDFIHRVENNRRTAQITKVNVTPTPNGDFNFIVTVNLFIKP